MTVIFKYELGETVADCDGAPGLVIERFPRVVTRPHEDGRPGNRAARVAGYKVAFPALEDGGAAFVVICEGIDLFPPTVFEELEEWDDEDTRLLRDAEDTDEVEARRVTARHLRLVK